MRQLHSPVRWADTVREDDRRRCHSNCRVRSRKSADWAQHRRIERRKEIGMFALEDSPAIDAALASCQESSDA